MCTSMAPMATLKANSWLKVTHICLLNLIFVWGSWGFFFQFLCRQKKRKKKVQGPSQLCFVRGLTCKTQSAVIFLPLSQSGGMWPSRLSRSADLSRVREEQYYHTGWVWDKDLKAKSSIHKLSKQTWRVEGGGESGREVRPFLGEMATLCLIVNTHHWTAYSGYVDLKKEKRKKKVLLDVCAQFHNF